MPTERRPRIQAVSGLRFLAALHVLTYHAATLGMIDVAGLPPVLRALVGTGYTTTSMFLVLSGFMLYYAYADEGGSLRGSPRDLWASRFAMLYPIAALSQLLALPTAVVGTERLEVADVGARLAAALTMTQAWIPPVTFTLNGPAWTLSCLAVFYFVFPAILERIRGWTTARSVAALVACWVVAQTVAWTYWLNAPEAHGAAGTDHTNWLAVMLHAWPPVRFPEFLSGVLLAHLLIGRRAVAVPTHRLAPAIAAGVLGLLVTLLVAAYYAAPFVVLHNGLLLPAHWLLIGSLCVAPGLVGRVLGAPLVARLGDTSLPLFLLHVPLLRYANYAFTHGYLPAHWTAKVAAVGAIIFASHLTAVHLVQPLSRRIKSRLTGAKSLARPPLASVPGGAAPARVRATPIAVQAVPRAARASGQVRAVGS